MSEEKSIVVIDPGALSHDSLVAPSVDPATVFLSRFSGEALRVMKSSLCTLGTLLKGTKVSDPRTVNWAAVRYPHAQRLRNLMDSRAPATANRLLSALRGVVEECWKLGLMDREASARVQAIKAVPGNKQPKGRALSPEEVGALYAACTQETHGRRDAAVLALAVGGGLRRSEICGLNLEHWNGAQGAVTVLGKGKKWRIVYLSMNARAAIESWLTVRGAVPGPLVVAINKAGRLNFSKRLTDDGVYALLAGLATAGKVARFTPHDLRRTFFTALLEAGVDALTVSKLAGHANVQTTMGYDKRGEPVKQEAVSRLKF